MAVYHAAELEDIHRWLPLEILEDIGIANADELRTMAVVEELPSRLAAVLGGAIERGQRRALPPERAVSSHQHQVCGLAGRGYIPSSGGGNRQRLFLSNGSTLDLPMFAPAWSPLPVVVQLPAKQSGAGTGVFLPRTWAAQNANPSWNGSRAESRYSKQHCRQKQTAAQRRGKGEFREVAAKQDAGRILLVPR